MVRLRIKEIALEKGFNQSSLARETGLGFSTIKRLWKDPYKKTNTEILEKVAKVLGVPTPSLIEDVPDEE